MSRLLSFPSRSSSAGDADRERGESLVQRAADVAPLQG